MRHAGLVLTLFVFGCGGVPPAAEEAPAEHACEGHDDSPRGEPSDYALAAGAEIDGAAVAAPIACERESAYIAITRPNGRRTLATARERGGGFSEECTSLPEDPAGDACPGVNPAPILTEVHRLLAARGVETNGLGLGPCGDPSGEYEAWNFSLGVVSWADAEAAVRATVEVLARYDVAGTIGVAVRGVVCGVALER